MGTVPASEHPMPGKRFYRLLDKAPRRLQEALAAWGSTQPPAAKEILIVDSDATYRDRVLVPSLRALGLRKIHKAKSAAAAARELDKHADIALVITSAELHNGDNGLAVCWMAKAASVPVVLLSDAPLPASETLWLADRVARRNGRSVFQTVREVLGTATAAKTPA